MTGKYSRKRHKLAAGMDHYHVKKKLQNVYLICVLLSLILVDSVIIYIVAQSGETSRQHRMENVASAVSYNFINQVDITARTAKSIYMNKYINRFLEKEYDSPLDYVNSCQSFMKDTLIESGFADTTLITMYSDNETIVSGGIFGKISTIQDSEWYQYFKQSDEDQLLYYYYDDSSYPTENRERKLLFLRKLNFYQQGKEKVVCLEMDYGNLVANLVKMNYGMPVYICDGETVLLSNSGKNSVGKEFDTFSGKTKGEYTKDMNLYGLNLTIYVDEPKTTVYVELIHNLPIVLILVLINIILPIMFIHIVYKNKLKEQEMDIARQNAELKALHSQINPHFLFNALESIRMHSVLKKEYETADMVEKLASMARQNVEWGNDLVEVEKEMEFVRAYLGLQKYRFGDRLSYEIEVEEECKNRKIPKLTVVTFVENACVHGIESKMTPGWIFVRAYVKDDNLCLEIEDTGCGMEETFMEELREKMKHASMEHLREKERVGIINACLRLRMLTEDKVQFELDGEVGAGTMVQIRIPISYTDKKEGKVYVESTVSR